MGSAINGDAWAIDTEQGERVVILSHDRILPEEVEDPRDAAHPVAASLAEALARAEEGTLPRDHEEAGARLPAPDAEEEAQIEVPDTEIDPPPEARPRLVAALLGPESGVEWEDLEDALYELASIERAVLRRRHGLGGAASLTVAQTAAATGLTAAEVKRYEASGLAALKRLLAGGASRR